MRRHIVLEAALGVTACLLPAFAQSPTQPLSLDDCIRLAESVPSEAAVASLEREIAARDTGQARSAFLPQSRLLNGFIYNSPLLGNREVFSFIPLNGIREYASLLTVTQELDLSGRLRADLARARAAEQSAAAAARVAQRDLRRAVTASYYRALLARRLVRIIEDALEESRSFERRTQQLAEAGEAARADLVKASAQAAFLEQSLAAARLAADLAGQELASFWTSDLAAPPVLKDVLDEPVAAPEPEPLPPSPFLNRPEFGLLDSRRRAVEAEARQARAALLPQFNLTFQYGLDSSAMRIADRGYAAFVSLNIPVFDWNRARHAIAQARLRAQQVNATREISERRYSQEYQSALARVKQLFEQISLAREQTRLAAEDLRLSRLRYEGGEGSALDVVTAQNQLAQARTNYYTAVAEYWNARADLEVAIGK